jgi:hypothetical protein
MDFIHRLEFEIARQRNVSETGTASGFGEGKETRSLLGAWVSNWD